MESLNSKPLALGSVAGPVTRRRKALLTRAQAAGSDGVPDALTDTAATPTCQQQQQQQLSRKRQRLPACDYELSLFVRWCNIDGRARVSRLPLTPIGGVEGLRGLFRRLIKGAFPPHELPDYLTRPDVYYMFTPAEEFVSLPGDATRTEFRLVVTLDGWEHTVAERELGVLRDPERNMLVTVAEFESDSFEVEGQEIILNLVSYPTVCVARSFLDDAVRSLVASGAGRPTPQAAAST